MAPSSPAPNTDRRRSGRARPLTIAVVCALGALFMLDVFGRFNAVDNYVLLFAVSDSDAALVAQPGPETCWTVQWTLTAGWSQLRTFHRADATIERGPRAACAITQDEALARSSAALAEFLRAPGFVQSKMSSAAHEAFQSLLARAPGTPGAPGAPGSPGAPVEPIEHLRPSRIAFTAALALLGVAALCQGLAPSRSGAAR